MKHKITFFPIGNADTSLIQLNSGKNILWDYANMCGDKHCDLPNELAKRVNKDYYDVVCFTHADNDHVKGMKDYFYLEHTTKYQSNGRMKINDLWVPAALLLESRNDLCEDAATLKAEARFRFLTQKRGIKVFSKPEELRSWIEGEGVSFETVSHLIVDAGICVPGWEKDRDGVEFFVHSPFKGHVDDLNVIDRNCAAIVVQALFNNNTETRVLLGSDISANGWRDIVWVTKYHGVNVNRLIWDVLHTSHHCSYKSINKEEKGDKKTNPIDETKWLYEVQSKERCIIVIPSDPIPDSYENNNGEPVHRQAYNYYVEDVADPKNGTVEVIMEFPNINKPEPIEIIIGDNGAEIVRTNPPATVYIKENSSPRNG